MDFTNSHEKNKENQCKSACTEPQAHVCQSVAKRKCLNFRPNIGHSDLHDSKYNVQSSHDKTDEKEARVNRKNWIVAGIVVVVLLVAGTLLLMSNDTGTPQAAVQGTPASSLTYCNDEATRPCVVSFGVDADGNMLVNLLMPDRFFPAFYLKALRGAREIIYDCRRVNTAPNSAYCIGEKLPPGEVLHLMLLSTRDDTLLAEGDLSIIGLAFPTVDVVTSTPITPTAGTLTASPTQTRTPLRTPTPTRTAPSYPNPTSYPNPSYP
jgi:hypothetical protein